MDTQTRRIIAPSLRVPLIVAAIATSWFSSLGGPTDTAAAADPVVQRRTAVVDVFERCKDAVVNISSTQIIQLRSPFGPETMMDDLFDLPRPFRTRQYKTTSVGSGFVVHPAGYIVTNAHVVARTVDRKVIFSDQKEYDAQVVALDSEHDLALLKIEADRPLVPLGLGRSDDLMVGETVIAIGNPLGYQHTVTSGVVSALNRELDVSEGVTFRGLIQTDASINPGNSGGPLLNVLGQLIGINTAIRGDAQNIGFAIPVNQLRELMPQLLDVERRYRIRTGLTIDNASPARVVRIDPRSPAEAAGLRVGDVIERLDAQTTRTGIDYLVALVGRRPGERLAIDYQRDGKTGRATLTLAARPRPDAALLLRQQFGVTAEAVPDNLARSLRLRPGTGIVVTRIEQGSPADKVRLERGDIIIQLGPHQLTGMDDLGELLERIPARQSVPIAVLRVQRGTIYRLSAPITARGAAMDTRS